MFFRILYVKIRSPTSDHVRLVFPLLSMKGKILSSGLASCTLTVEAALSDGIVLMTVSLKLSNVFLVGCVGGFFIPSSIKNRHLLQGKRL